MSRLPEGVRPYRTELGKPLAKVTIWEIDTYGALDAEGRKLPRKRWKIHGSKSKAAAIRRNRIVELSAGRDPTPKDEPRVIVMASKSDPDDPDTITLRQYVETHYYTLSGVRESTKTARKGHLERYILPMLGGLPLTEVNTPEAVRLLKAELKKQPRIKSLDYRNQILLTLSGILSMASDPHVHGKPFLKNKIRIPPFRSHEFAEHQETYKINGFTAGHLRHKRLSDEHVRALLKACKESKDPDYSLVVVGLGLYLGCRNGEACGLRWEDLDLKRGEAKIWSSVSPRHDWVPRTKSLAGVVAIERSLLKALKRLRKRHKSWKYVLGPNENGSPHHNTRNVGDKYALLTAAAGFKSYNYHALRHTFCSRLADVGFRAEEIQQLARHKSIKSTYGYITPSRERLASAAAALSFG